MKLPWIVRGPSSLAAGPFDENIFPAPARVALLRGSELIAAARQGGEMAFQMLFERHKQCVYSLCLNAVRQPAKAEELTRLAFLDAFRKIANMRSESDFSISLRRAALSRIITCLRENPRAAEGGAKSAVLDEPCAAVSTPSASR